MMTPRDVAVAAAFLRRQQLHQGAVVYQRRHLVRLLDALAVHLVEWPWPGFVQAVDGTNAANLAHARELFDAWRSSTYSRVLDQRMAVEAASDAGIRRNYAERLAWCEGVLRALPPYGAPS